MPLKKDNQSGSLVAIGKSIVSLDVVGAGIYALDVYKRQQENYDTLMKQIQSVIDADSAK